MLSLTNKKGMSSEALGSSDFRAIADQATAAQYSTKTAGLAFKSGNKMDAKELVNTFDQGLTSIDQYFSSIEKVKNSTGKLVVDNQAVAKTIDMIKKSEMGRQQIGQDTLDELIKQKPELSVILNKSDTIADAWVKTKLYTSGITADLSKISGADAAKMLQVVEAIRTAADAMTKTDTNKATNPMLYGLARAYTSSQSAAKTAAELAKRASDAAQVDLNAEIKLIDKKIQLINDEFDARKKLIDYTAAKETYQNQLAQEQLKYQQAIANGDQTGAAQAQINMRQLNQEYQKQEALRVLEEKRNAEIKAWEDKKAKMQEDAALLQAKAAKLQAAAATAQQKANSIAIIQQSIANTLTQAAVTKDESRLKLYAKSLQSDINSLKKLDPSNASLINPIMTSSTDSNGKTTASADWMATLKDLISGKNNLLSDAGTTFKDGAELFKQYVSKLLGLAPVGTGGVKADLAGLAGTRTGKGVTGDPYVYKNAAGQSITEKQWNSMPLSAPKGSTAYKVPSTNISGQTYSGRDEIINAFRDEFKKDNVTADGFKYLAQGQVVKGGKMVGLWFQPLADQSGRYKAYRRGGLLRGPGTGTSDSIFMPQMSGGRFASGAYVSTGEYVVNAKATSQPGILGLLDKINNQSFNMPARTSFNASSNFSGNGMITTPVINVYGAAGQDERMIGEIVMARLSDWTAKQNSQMRAIGTSKVVGGR
jgi:hypothetical protein